MQGRDNSFAEFARMIKCLQNPRNVEIFRIVAENPDGTTFSDLSAQTGKERADINNALYALRIAFLLPPAKGIGKQYKLSKIGVEVWRIVRIVEDSEEYGNLLNILKVLEVGRVNG